MEEFFPILYRAPIWALALLVMGSMFVAFLRRRRFDVGELRSWVDGWRRRLRRRGGGDRLDRCGGHDGGGRLRPQLEWQWWRRRWLERRRWWRRLVRPARQQ